MSLMDEMTGWKEELVSIRRYLHMHPEPSMKEFKTSAYVKQKLDSLGINWVQAGSTGVIASIQGTGDGPVVGLRGDMDALEMDELNQVDYASVNPGCMHACGHDAHTSALLCAGAYLKTHSDKFHGTVKLIFQPGEENGQGAQSVVDSGAANGIESIFALHVANSLPIGHVTIRSGAMSSANDKFRIWIKGKGCHGSSPQNGADALIAGANLVNVLQNLITRESDPLLPTVMTIGISRSGTAFNILPEDAYIEGSVRVLEEDRRFVNRDIIKRMANMTATAFKCTARVEFETTAKVVYNDEHLTDVAVHAAEKLLGKDAVAEQPLSLGAEDFGAFVPLCPVTYMNIGSRNEAKGLDAPHHSGHFDIDEDCLPICMGMYIQFIFELIGN